MLKCLQAGRALAALAVVAFHLSTAFGDPRYGGREIGHAFTLHGDLGVDFFFVLSGFIILNAHAKDIGQPQRWTRYVWRRFARVYPIYWLYLAVFCALLLAGFGQVAKPPADGASWLSAVSLFRFSPDAPPLVVAWTLFHEVAFYVLFSLLILNRWLGIAVMAVWAVVCAALYHETGESGASAFSVYTSAFNLEFFFGMAAYGLYRRGRQSTLLIALGAAVIAGGFALIHFAGRVEHDIFGLGFAFAVAGIAIAESKGKAPSPSALVALGGASYSLYLVHMPVTGLLLKIAQLSGLTSVLAPGAVWWLVYATTVAVAYGAWLFLEKPIQLALRFGAPPATLAVPASAR